MKSAHSIFGKPAWGEFFWTQLIPVLWNNVTSIIDKNFWFDLFCQLIKLYTIRPCLAHKMMLKIRVALLQVVELHQSGIEAETSFWKRFLVIIGFKASSVLLAKSIRSNSFDICMSSIIESSFIVGAASRNNESISDIEPDIHIQTPLGLECKVQKWSNWVSK